MATSICRCRCFFLIYENEYSGFVRFILNFYPKMKIYTHNNCKYYFLMYDIIKHRLTQLTLHQFFKLLLVKVGLKN